MRAVITGLLIILVSAGPAFAQAPDTTAAHAAMQAALNWWELGQYDSSMACYQRAADRYRAYAEDGRHLNAAARQNNWAQHFNAIQQLSWVLAATGAVDSALAVLSAARNEADRRLAPQHLSFASFDNVSGYVNYMKGAYEQTLTCFLNARAGFLRLYGTRHAETAMGYYNVGMAYGEVGAYGEACEATRIALAIRLELYGRRHPDVAVCYNNLGSLYRETGAYEQALAHHQQALAIRLELYGPNHPMVADSYVNMGTLHMTEEASDLAQALNYFQKALMLYQDAVGPHDADIALCYLNIGVTYLKLDDFGPALDYCRKALDLDSALFGTDHPRVAADYFNLGLVYLDKGDHDQAWTALQKASDLRLQRLGDDHPLTADGFAALALACYELHRYEQALDYLEKSLTVYISDYQSPNAYTRPGMTSVKVLRIPIQAKTELLLKRRAPGDDAAALATVRFADRLIDSLRVAHTYESDKLKLGEDASQLYAQALDVARWNNLDKEAFYYAEKNKAAVLAQALNESDALRFGHLPDSLAQKDKYLKLKLTFYNKTILERELECPHCDSALIRDLQARRFDRQQQYTALKTTLEQNYPEYFALKYKQHTAGVDELQSGFLKENPNTAILEYFLTDSLLWAFCVTKDVYKIHRQRLDTTRFKNTNVLQLEVRKLNRALADTKLALDPPARLGEPATALYDYLIKHFEAEIKGKDLVVIPDGELTKIPFEVLTKENKVVKWADLPYLGKTHGISYHYSATLFLDQWRKKPSAGQGFVAFAPVFADTTTGQIVNNTDVIETPLIASIARGDTASRAFLNDGSQVAPLPATEREVKAIYDLFTQKKQPAQYYLSGNADEATVTTADLHKYKYIHFATHGLTDEDHPDRSCLILAQTKDSTYDNLLTGSEMYGLNLDADLVVLSACQTGKGQLRAGEGVIGLTRGLLYAGARNLIVSQWNVNDASTAELMTRFYTHLLNGQSNRAALRKAKLELLSGPYACPHYWAPFVLVGR